MSKYYFPSDNTALENSTGCGKHMQARVIKYSWVEGGHFLSRCHEHSVWWCGGIVCGVWCGVMWCVGGRRCVYFIVRVYVWHAYMYVLSIYVCVVDTFMFSVRVCCLLYVYYTTVCFACFVKRQKGQTNVPLACGVGHNRQLERATGLRCRS